MNWDPGTTADRTPDRPAAIIGEARLSYGMLEADSAAIAAMLYARGLVHGDTIAILVGNRPEFFTIAWAAQRSGLYYVAIPPRLTAPEIGYILQDSGARALFVDPAYATLADAASYGMALQRFGITAPDGDFAPAPAIEGADMLYTSGTTGRPKGVRRPLTGQPLGSDGRRVARAQSLFGLGHDSVFLSPAPLYHAAPLRFTMNLLRTGGTVIGMPRFDAATSLELIARHGVTHSQWVPTMFTRLLALDPSVRVAHDLSSHRVAIHAGGPCAVMIKRQMIDWWGPILQEYYSGTESIGFTHVTSTEWLARPGTVGRPYGAAIHILDDAGIALPPGATGAVYFEGHNDLSYHNDPVKTAAAHDASGRATMGDIGHVDSDGYLFITDRKAFTIISGGVNVYPTEVEDALTVHPLVADVAVFGIPDFELGEQVFAVVQLNDGVGGDADLALALHEFASARLARFKLPRRIAFAPVGRSETGKVPKAQLREYYRDGSGSHHLAGATRSASSVTGVQPNDTAISTN